MITSVILILLHLVGIANSAKPKFPMYSMGEDDTTTPFKAPTYTKYTHYPKYCSIPSEMETRATPPLTTGTSNDGTSKLIHVTAIIRHGARTPFRGAPDYKCWNGYWDDPETGVWNCDLKTYISPPAATKDKGHVVIDSKGEMIEEEPDFLFEKRYDALSISSNNGDDKTGNNLNGTCQLGQLLMRGYDQELRNGLHLRQAYFYDGDDTADEHAAADSRMRLWDLTTNDNDNGDGRETSTSPVIGDSSKPIYEEPNLRYRADDEQRTLMSGQVLLRGLFEKEFLAKDDDETAVIPLHTADFFLDVMGINEYTCPRTLDLRNEAYSSDEYKKWINSMEVKTVKKFLKDVLNMEEIPYSMLDCLMTTICTDRTLPSQLNDYDGSLGPTDWSGILDPSHSTAMFERIANFATKNYTFAYKYNDGAWAKLGMGPLWKEIMRNINLIVDSNSDNASRPPKLALFSGHDTTIMPLLATLGDKVWSGTEWSPYASMMQIELHEVLNGSTDYPSGYAFRLIYNGGVLTSNMDGCTGELCDVQVLVKQVMPFAKYMERDCASQLPPVPTPTPPADDSYMTEMKTATNNLVHTPGGVAVIMLLVILGLVLGGILMWLLIKRHLRMDDEYRRRRESTILGDLSMSAVEEEDAQQFHTTRGIDSAIATHGDEKKFDDEYDEDNII